MERGFFLVMLLNNDEILRRIISIFFKKQVSFILSFLLVLMQAKALGAELRGELAQVLVFPLLFVIIAESGMRQATSYFLAKTKYSSEVVLGTAKLFFIISSILASVLLYYVQVYRLNDVDLGVIYLSVLFLPFMVFNSYNSGILLGINKTSSFGNTILIPKILQFIFVLCLFLNGYLTVATTVLSYVILSISTFFSGRFYALRYISRPKVSHFNFDLMCQMIKLGSLYGVSLFLLA